ncbi:hypothetical protein C8J56DRAFT_1170002 [Mycena floridula]|nr:hypothetical protein C8J56DRAFT_1170002 [Mycena floridula]
MAPILSLRAGELATDLAGLVVPYDLSSSAVVRDGSTFEDLFEDLDVRSDDEGSDDEDDLVESEDSDDESSSIAATITSTTRDSSTTSLISSISPTVTSTIPVITSTSARPTVTSSIRRTTDVGSISTSSIARSTVTSSPTSSPISSLPSAQNVSNTAGGIDSPPSPTGASIAPATIAGVTILGIFALLVTLFLLWCRRRRRNAWSNSSDEKFTVFPFPFPVEYATQQPRAPEYTRSNHSGMSWVSEGSWTVRASKISNFVRGPRFSRFTRATQPESTNTNSTVSRSLWN